MSILVITRALGCRVLSKALEKKLQSHGKTVIESKPQYVEGLFFDFKYFVRDGEKYVTRINGCKWDADFFNWLITGVACKNSPTLETWNQNRGLAPLSVSIVLRVLLHLNEAQKCAQKVSRALGLNRQTTKNKTLTNGSKKTSYKKAYII
jgi:hypothetical protein